MFRVDRQHTKKSKECSSQFQLNNAIPVKLNVFSDGFLLRDGNRIAIVSRGLKMIPSIG